MSHQMKSFLITIAACLAFAWCAAAFINLDLNPANWHSTARAGVIGFGIFAGLFITIARQG